MKRILRCLLNTPAEAAIAELCFAAMRQWKIRVRRKRVTQRPLVTVEETENDCLDDEKHLDDSGCGAYAESSSSEQFLWGRARPVATYGSSEGKWHGLFMSTQDSDPPVRMSVSALDAAANDLGVAPNPNPTPFNLRLLIHTWMETLHPIPRRTLRVDYDLEVGDKTWLYRQFHPPKNITQRISSIASFMVRRTGLLGEIRNGPSVSTFLFLIIASLINEL
jgi:hypothetical protein